MDHYQYIFLMWYDEWNKNNSQNSNLSNAQNMITKIRQLMFSLNQHQIKAFPLNVFYSKGHTSLCTGLVVGLQCHGALD